LEHFSFGASAQFNLFTTSPVVSTEQSELLSTLEYRIALEAIAAIASYATEGSSESVDSFLDALASDLNDGAIDGKNGDESLTTFTENPNLLNRLLGAPVKHLEVDGTDKDGDESTFDPYSIDEMNALLVAEQSVLGTNIEAQTLVDGTLFHSIIPLSQDFDLDGFPNLSDDDDDNDGVEDILDAFPENSSESEDTDGDGVGDNSDFYVSDSACSSENQGNGEACYITWLLSKGIDEIETSISGLVFYYAKTSEIIVSYDLVTSKYTEIALELDENEYLNVMDFSEAQNRLYLGYSSGKINFVNAEDLSLNSFASTSEGVYGISSVGDYVLAQDNSGAWESHYIFDINGIQTDWEEWNHYSSYYAWNDTLARVYFFKDGTSPNDLMYEEIEQSTGQITADAETPYHGDYSISGPILISPDGQKVLLGSGDVYNASNLEFENSIGFNFVKGVWSEAVGLTTIAQQEGAFLLSRLNDDFLVVEQKSYEGALLKIISQLDKAVFVIQNNNAIEYVDFIANDDIDNDGVENLIDAFPDDVAASIDTDNDGAPDSWNLGYTQIDSTTELVVDAFPIESACALTEHGVNGVCNPTARLAFNTADMSRLVEGVVYSLSSGDNRINRWAESSESYLNPIMLSNNAIWGKPISFVVGNDYGVLVGYDSGAIVSYSLDGLSRPEIFTSMADAVHQLFIAGEHIVVIHGDGNYYRDYQVLDADANTLSTYTRGDFSNDYTLNETSNRLYWFSNSYSDSLESYIIDDEGQISDYSSLRYNGNPTSFMAVSVDESLIITGENILIKNYATDAIVTELERPVGLTTLAELSDFGWLDNVAVGLYTNETNYYLGFYSKNLEFTYTFIELEHEIVSMFAAEDNIVAVVEEQGSFNVVVIAVEQDEDQDGLPKWWEISYGLDDADAADASADSDEDNLSNLQEFQALTDPLLADTDSDGLNDGREVLDLMLNPLAADTDGDFLPDLWEVENGLDGSDVSDAQLDSDNDGVINFHEYLSGTDPQDSASVPEAIVDSLFSFEDSVLPDEWEVSGDTTFSSAQSYQGDISLAMNGDVTIKWERLYANVELDFHLFSDCYSIYDKSYELYVDGQLESSGYIEQVEWTKLNLLVHAGFKDVSLVIDSNDSNCNLYIDAVNAIPMRSVFELSGNVVSKYEGKLHFYSYDGALVRETSIPIVLDGPYDARDIVVLDDGRVAVYNGVFQPVLSIYTPSENKWESIAAPAWSTVNNGTYGGIDAIGNKVFVTNMSTSGSSTSGIVQFDLDDSSVSYVEGAELIDLTVGYDGYVYGLTGASVYKYEASTLEVIDTVSIDSARSIAVDADGNIYAATWNSSVNKYQQDGTLIRTLEQSASFYDIALRANGFILLSDRSKYVYQTDTNLTVIERRTKMSAEFLDFVPDVDSDADGLPNWWEYAFGLDMDNSLDASIDHDSDGLSALTEYEIGTEEGNEDTDSDGLSDGYEYNTYGTDPTVADADNDGLLDGQEEELGTDPNNIDSDEDGLGDYEEIMTYNTNPLETDTDLDGMEDAYEITFGLDANVNDASSDLDGDGLTNIEEHDVGSDPNLLDTDGDTLSDYDEVITHLTSPILNDTDSDKLPDKWELQYSNDPLSAENASMDVDADQFSALEEYYGNTDPSDASDFPLPIAWKTDQGNERHTGYTPHILDSSKFSFKWEVDSLWGSLLPVTATDSMVFVSSDSYFSSQGIAGLDAKTGNIVWQLDYEGIHSINAPAYDDGNVFFQTGGHGDSYIRSVDALTGELEFESSYGNQWSRYLAPTIYAGNVYMAGGYYGGTYGFDGSTGEQSWFYSGPQYDEFTPAVDENNVYSFTTKLDILDRSTGALTNSIAFPNFNWSGYSVGVSTVITRNNNVVVTQRGTLVVFDVENLKIKWEKVSSGFSSQVSVANGNVYALANGSLYSIDEESGETHWIQGSRNYNTNIIVTKTHLIVGDSSNTYAINLDTKEEDWSYAASGYLALSEEGTLYISGSSLVAITLK